MMEPIFESKIIGQDLSQIERAVRRAKVGLSLRNQPYGAFLLAGPTGVGKTETVHALADYLHGNANQVLTIHCAEYQHSHEIARLIGAPPGYLGHDTARPVLSQQALNQVTSMQSNVRLVLFDEIEKADPALFQLTLGILDKGVLHLSTTKETADFSQALIFFTTNLGSRDYNSQYSLAGQGSQVKSPRSAAERAIRKFFSPEWLNRLTGIVYYNHLSHDHLWQIIHRRVIQLQVLILIRRRHNLTLEITDDAVKQLIVDGYSSRYGAREVLRTLDNLVLDYLTEKAEQEQDSDAKSSKVRLLLTRQNNQVVAVEISKKGLTQTSRA